MMRRAVNLVLWQGISFLQIFLAPFLRVGSGSHLLSDHRLLHPELPIDGHHSLRAGRLCRGQSLNAVGQLGHALGGEGNSEHGAEDCRAGALACFHARYRSRRVALIVLHVCVHQICSVQREHHVKQDERTQHASVDESQFCEGRNAVAVGLEGGLGILPYHLGYGVEGEDSADGGNGTVGRGASAGIGLLGIACLVLIQLHQSKRCKAHHGQKRQNNQRHLPRTPKRINNSPYERRTKLYPLPQLPPQPSFHLIARRTQRRGHAAHAVHVVKRRILS
mmetsp:Transcript_1808/g.3468  ORF Transcript_1808/g.3468 Transcript_1808/m.3468 type:complete len:278 (-) Transcript_1808:2193-3026(-)